MRFSFSINSISTAYVGSLAVHAPPVVMLGVLLLQPFAVLPLFLCLLRIERPPHCFRRLYQEYGVECFAEHVM